MLRIMDEMILLEGMKSNKRGREYLDAMQTMTKLTASSLRAWKGYLS